MVNKKSLACAFLATIFLSGLVFASAPRFGTVEASAGDSGISEPSVPEFTLKYIDLSYDVPPTYGIDQYTGETVITQSGYSVDNRSIQFIIKNQYFTPYTDSNGTQIDLYYNFKVKGAYGTEWRYYPFASNGYTTRLYGGLGSNSTESPADFVQSDSEYTIITIPLRHLLSDVPDEAQLEVQVQALIGYMEPTDYMMAGHAYIFTGESSDWSNTQTLTVGENQTPTSSPTTTPTPAPSEEPQQTDNLTPIIGVAIVAVVLGSALGLLTYLIKRK